jgi:hypothetical protein
MPDDQVRELMQAAVAQEVHHSALAQQARDRRENLEAQLRDHLPPTPEAPPGGWPKTTPDDLSDIVGRVTFTGSRNIHDRLLRVAAAAGPRQLSPSQVAAVMAADPEFENYKTKNIAGHARQALLEKPETYIRTGSGTFRYRWA